MIYHIEYTLFQSDKVHSIDVSAKSKRDAYAKATYELIPDKEGASPYASWVASSTSQKGNYRQFNTFAGNPY